MMMSAEGPSRDANCTPRGAAQRREPQVSGDHAAEPLAFVGLRGTLAQDALLARYTSWRVGGRADILYSPADRDDLAHFLRGLPA
jgi:hypothetical protein